MSHRVTMALVARKAGTSTATVSLVLNGRAKALGIAADTQARVRRAAEALGYRCDPVARGLRTRRTGIVGVVLPDLTLSFCADVLQGIEDAAVEAGFGLLVRTCGRDAEREERCLNWLYEKHVDAVLLTSFLPGASLPAIRRLTGAGVPVILTAGDPKEKLVLPWGGIDDEAVGRMATAHLIGLGHRRIAHFRVNARRLAGYRRALADAGIEFSEKLVVGGFADSFDVARKRAEGFLSGPWAAEGVTAVYAGYDLQAAALVSVAAERGIAVPTALSVIGTDNLAFSAMTNPPLTTVDLPKREIGIETFRRAVAWLDGRKGWQDRLYPGNLVVRGSCAPAAGA